jgi:hypothetical protein
MGFGVFIVIPMLVGGGGFNSPWLTVCILFILDCQKSFNIENKVAGSYYENFNYFDKNC